MGIMIKPDGVQRGLVGEIISRFEKKGFKLVAMKVMGASVEHLEKHYPDLSSKGFFRGLVTYMASGPVCAMVWEGLNAVKTGTIRGDYAIHVGRNICHGSDAVESANHEIALWFKPEELNSWTPAQNTWVYE